MRKTAGLLAAVALLGSALLVAPAADAAVTYTDITGTGSSFAGGILTACATRYAAAYPTAGTITYTASNSQGGKDAYRTKSYTFGASDFEYTGTGSDNMPTGAKYVPVTSGPIAIMYNLSGISSLKITPQLLAKIFNGDITQWDDTEITSIQSYANAKKLNALSSKAITPAYRTAGSGTTFNFSGYLHDTTNNFVQSSTWATATGDATPAGNSYTSGSNLKAGVLANPGAIGYADLKDATGTQIALLRNQDGQYYAADAKRAATFFLAQTDLKANGLVDLDWTMDVPGGYNASLYTYAIVNNGTDAGYLMTAGKANTLKKYLGYVLSSCGPTVSYGLGYTPILGAVRTKALALVNYIK